MVSGPARGRTHAAWTPPRFLLALRTPILLNRMAALMLQPSAAIIRTYGIPQGVVDEAYTHNPRHRQMTIDTLRKVHQLCSELQLITPLILRLWQRFGLVDMSVAAS